MLQIRWEILVSDSSCLGFLSVFCQFCSQILLTKLDLQTCPRKAICCCVHLYFTLPLSQLLSPHFQRSVWYLLKLCQCLLIYTYFHLAFLLLLLTTTVTYLVSDKQEVGKSAGHADAHWRNLGPEGLHMYLGRECVSLSGNLLR